MGVMVNKDDKNVFSEESIRTKQQSILQGEDEMLRLTIISGLC